MKRFLQLLRLEYSISWLLFYFAGLIYLKSIYFIDKFDPTFIVAALFFTISVNVHNDLCDGKFRGYKKNFLKYIIIISFITGLSIFPNIILVLAAFVVYLYNWKLKKILYLSILSMLAPGLGVMGILQIYDPLPLIAVIFTSLAIQCGHQLIDGDIRNKNYYYIHTYSFCIATLLVSIILFDINIALSWMAFIIFSICTLSILRVRSVNRTIKILRSINKEQRAFIIFSYWVIFTLLAGWYILITF